MSSRELVVLGSASQTPTRHRNHNGYLLRWDGRSILFDPGEGTQRQLLLAGASPTSIDHICVTHFHGDHCLGLPGILQRLSLDRVDHPVEVLYPASGGVYFDRLRHASAYQDHLDVRPVPVVADGPVSAGPAFTIEAVRLDHDPETFGWRVVEPDGVRMVPERLEDHGLEGPDVGRLLHDGEVVHNGERIVLGQVAEVRPGQRMAFVMDTGMCDAAVSLAAGADLVVCEATFADRDAELARRYRHLTASDAARVARDAGARRLVITHFSQRYPDVQVLLDEALDVFPDVVAAEDLLRVPLPPRRRPNRAGPSAGDPDADVRSREQR
ncbi:MAG: ribonuclease Z [Acidimicrobiales bacterium]|jgi:ribonuclease Z